MSSYYHDNLWDILNVHRVESAVPFALLGKQKFIKRWRQCCQYNLNPFVCMYVCMYLLLLFYYSCPNFPPLFSPAPHHSHSQSPPCRPCLRVIYTCSLSGPFFFLPLSSLPLPSCPCQFVHCFHASGSILLICLLCSLSL